MFRVFRQILRGFLVLLFFLLVEIVLLNGKQEDRPEEEEAPVMLSEELEEAYVEPVREIIPERELVELPKRYDYRLTDRAPQVKDQKEINNCWAFAGASALESVLLPDDRTQFSADHMTYHNTYSIAPEEGGAYVMAVSYLTGWLGPVLEAEDPSGDGVSPENLAAARQVLEVRMPDYKDYAAIKQTILLYGGVESSLYLDFTEMNESSVSYNPSESSYCYEGETEPNHDILIIGWDDNFSAERFQSPPQGNGAFICLNSWGTEFGEDGVFYVSYYDSNIGGSNTAYIRMEEAGYFDGLYQSDLCGWTGQLGYASEEGWFANVFTAERQERLAGVGFYTTGMESTYEIYLVPEFDDALSLKDRVLITNGYQQYAGYHTVEFADCGSEQIQEMLRLQEGQQFAVIVHLITKDAGYPIAVEYARETDSHAAVNLQDGESYISDKGVLWSQAETECRSNVCLKAYVNVE